VDIDGDTALIGASGDDDNGDSSGSAYVFTRDGSGNWTEQAKLTASDGVLGDQFGLSVSVDGDTALIGARGDDDNGARSGSAYVFTRDGSGNWTEQDKLTASDGAQDDQFGLSVSVDGDTALIGAHFDDDNGTNSGSAYIFYFAITVTIDIKPGIGPNAINPKSKAVIPLAVLGSSDFDAMLVAWSTVQFGNGEAPPVHYGHVEDVNGDGFSDMVFHFKTQAAGVVCGDTEASFSGRTFGGESITGTDSIRTVACE
jgi:regulation of enolase protein 1 (concanavalin A-like superfamily)